MPTATLLIWFVFANLGPNQDPSWIVRAYFPPGSDLPQLRDLGEGINPLALDRERSFIIVEVTEEGEAYLHNLGWVVVLDEGQSRPQTEQSAELNGIPNYPCYPTLSETFAMIDQFELDYPNLASQTDIGDSWEKNQGLGGYDLVVLQLTNQLVVEEKPKVFIMSGLHAREYSPTGVTTRFAQLLLENYGHDADATWILDHTEIHLLFSANPDGRLRAENQLLWRKNANNSVCPGDSRGVDLNRNFEFEWGLTSSCASTSTCSSTYRGPGPASEFETTAIQTYLRSIFLDQRGPGLGDPAPSETMGLFVDLHSYSELVLWPYGFNATVAPNGGALTSFGRKLARYNNYSPEKASQSFDTCGASDDFTYGDLGVAAFTFELGTQFFEPCDNLESRIWPENRDALLYGAKAARAPYLWPSGPNSEQVRPSASSLALGQPLSIYAQLSDDRFQQATAPPGTEPVQNIAAGELTLDDPPWTEAASAYVLNPQDGSFDTPNEAVETTVNTSGLSLGSHLCFVRGQDALGNWGAPSAAKVTLLDPASSFTLTGQVTALGGTPLEATIKVLEDLAYSDPSSGSYRLTIGPGPTTLLAEAEGYEPFSLTTLVGVAGTQRTLNIVLVPTCAAVSLPEADSARWTSSESWTLLDEGDGWLWDSNPDGDYANELDSTLVSPILVVAPAQQLTLSFHQSLALDPYGDDYVAVEYREGSGIWQSLTHYRGIRKPESIELALPPAQTTLPAQVRLRLHSDRQFGNRGWQVSRLQVAQRDNACVLGQLYENWPMGIDVRTLIGYL